MRTPKLDLEIQVDETRILRIERIQQDVAAIFARFKGSEPPIEYNACKPRHSILSLDGQRRVPHSKRRWPAALQSARDFGLR